MKSLLGFVIYLMALASLTSEARPLYRWSATSPLEIATAADQKLAEDANGNIYLVGTAQLGEAGWHIVTVKYNPRGRELWSQAFKTHQDGAENIRAIALDAAGNLHVASVTFDFTTGSNSITVLKYDPAGSLLWVRNRPGEPSDIGVDRTGNVYACGRDENHQNWLAKYDARGVLEWERRLETSTGIGALSALALDASGNVYATGFELSLFKLDPAGTLLWRKDFGGRWGLKVLLDSRENVYVTGQTFPFEALTVKLDSNGQVLWRSFYQHAASTMTEPADAVIDAADNLLLLTRSEGSFHNVTKHSSDGAVIWRTKETNAEEIGLYPDLAVDRQGGTWLLFTTADQPDAALVEYDSLGQRKSFRRFGSDNLDFGGDILINNKGRVVFSYTASFQWITGELR